MTDLANLTLKSPTAKVPLRHPATDEILTLEDGTEMFIEVYSTDSEHMQKVDRGLRDEALKRRNNKGLTAAKLENKALERVAAAVKSWNILEDGETPECTLENVRHVLKSYPWIYEQIESAMADRANFFEN